MLVETDVLVAALDPKDPNYHIAKRVFTRRKIFLSPYALIELDLLIRSGNVIVRDYIAFWHKLNDALEQYGIRIATPTPLHLATAHKLREQYGLTYFDSLHATIALAGNLELVSFDKGAYSKIPNLKYRHPHDLT